MQVPILSTKLYAPPPRPKAVHRPRLIEPLNEGLHRKLTLVSAPAGFGKTTLICEWIAGRERPVAWLSLDEADNDPSRFLTYLVAALQTIAPSIGAEVLGLLQSPQPPPTEVVLTALLNWISAVPNHFVLVLDDYHVIESPSVDNALAFILDHLPQQTGGHGGMHLIIASRFDPSLPLSRLRARDQMTEIREADLRFNLDETTVFLDNSIGLDLSSEEVTALVAHTEGWAAGLQLAALSMQGLKRDGDVSAFVDRFTSSDRYIHDYLADEVLQQRPKGTEDFLLQTSILDRLSGPLCDAVTRRQDSQSILETLEAANLFLTPLDDERRWYRYHHLFADLLRQRLRQALPEHVSSYHRRAGEWYKQNGFVDEAIEHALRAKDFDDAARQIEHVAEALWETGTDTKLQRWLAGLPVELLLSKPQLCIFHAWYLLADGNREAAEEVIRLVERALRSIPDGTDQLTDQAQNQQQDIADATLRGRAATVRAFSAFYGGEVPAIIQHARRALDYLPAQEMAWRSAATHILGDGYDLSGEMGDAYHARRDAVETSRLSNNSMQILVTSLKLAIILRNQGRLQQAIEICRQQMEFAAKNGMAQTVVAGWLLAIWGETLAELNELDDAIDKATDGVELTERGGDVAMLGWSYVCLIRTRFSLGDIAGAEEIVHRIEILAQDAFVPPWITDLSAAWQARLWLAQGEVQTASRWVAARGLNADRKPAYAHEMEYIVLARILLAQGRAEAAHRLLDRQFKVAEEGDRTSTAIEILILNALALQAQGDSIEAMAALRQALVLAEPGGYVRVFVDEGLLLGSLLHSAVTHGIVPDYTRRLLAAFSDSEAKMPSSSETRQPQSRLIEPLSPRELEVLQLVAQGLSNREICERLFLALSTVKGYTRSIYAKLAVQRRTEAVARARELDLL